MSISKKIHLREGEEILEILRRYPLTYFYVYIFSLALMVVATFFITWLFAHGWWGSALYGLVMLFGFFLFFQTWYFARANMLIITNQRAVDVSRTGWFDEIVSSVGHIDIVDVSFRRRGFFSNIFNYGDIYLQTKNKQFNLEIAKIHQPQKAVNFIMEQVEFRQEDKEDLIVEDVYNDFIKVIPELTEAELLHLDDIIHDRLEEDLVEEVEVI